jgi:four helix bundle protein
MNLNVSKIGIKLLEIIYAMVTKWPKEEDGLKSQLRRAVVSIPTNITEGEARNHQKEFIQFSYIALGSLSDIETLVEISKRIYSIYTKDINILLLENKKLRLGLIKHLKSNLIQQS